MDWKLFIARRIYRSNEGGKEVSKPAVRIAMLGIAIGLAVMIVSVAVVIGFKHEVRDKVVGLGTDIVITNFDSQQSYQTVPIVANDSLLHLLKTLEGVKHVQRYSTKPGMIMTSDSFQGMVLKGVSHEYDWRFLKNHLQEGEIPVFSDTASTNKVLVSRTIADRLHLKLGDKIYTYYIEDNVRARRLTVAGIYQTNFSAYDDLFLITDLYTVNRLNSWQKGQVSGIELEVNEYSRLESVKEEIRAQFEIYVKHLIMLGILKTGPDLTGAKAESMVDQIQKIIDEEKAAGHQKEVTHAVFEEFNLTNAENLACGYYTDRVKYEAYAPYWLCLLYTSPSPRDTR